MESPSIGSVCFPKYDENELIGACGVYVDDFIIAGTPNDPKWKAAKPKLKMTLQTGKWETNPFTLYGVRYQQKNGYSVVLDQQEFTPQMSTAELHVPKTCTNSMGGGQIGCGRT